MIEFAESEILLEVSIEALAVLGGAGGSSFSEGCRPTLPESKLYSGHPTDQSTCDVLIFVF